MKAPTLKSMWLGAQEGQMSAALAVMVVLPRAILTVLPQLDMGLEA